MIEKASENEKHYNDEDGKKTSDQESKLTRNKVTKNILKRRDQRDCRYNNHGMILALVFLGTVAFY